MNILIPETKPTAAELAAFDLTPFNPDSFPCEKLFDWLSRPRMPIWVGDDPFLRQLVGAVMERARVSFLYLEGSNPGGLRTISPDLVFQVDNDGPVYVSGYCHDRGKMRVFRFDRMLEAAALN